MALHRSVSLARLARTTLVQDGLSFAKDLGEGTGIAAGERFKW